MGRFVRKTRQEARHYWMPLSALVLLFAIVLLVAGVVQYPRQSAHAASADWPTFLGGNARTGYNSAEKAINPTTATNLKLDWRQKALGKISSQPIVANGLVYWGSWDGVEHATDISTGKNVWAVNLGQSFGSCGHTTYGVLSSATVASLAINGVLTPVVFVGGGSADLYALNANTGATIWHMSLASAPAHFSYSSTSLYNGSVYIGMASLGDCPLSDGGLFQVNAVTGQVQHTFHTVPQGCVGASVWGSPTIDEVSGNIYFATGNGGSCSIAGALSEDIIELRASDLSLVATWHVPSSQAQGDSDFGSTPTLFQATINGVLRSLVGVANKNGIYYAFDRTNISAGPLWQIRIAIAGASPEAGQGSISASAYDGTSLYVAGGNTTIQGKSCNGSVQALNPATGSALLQVCLSAPVLAPVTAVPGLVVVGSGHNMIVINLANGKQVFNFVDKGTGALFWGAATISNGMLYQGNLGGTLYAFGVPSTPTPGTTLAQDTFLRPDQSLWGKASDGQSWGADANTLSNFSISANSGQVVGSGTGAKNYNAVLGPTATGAEVLLSGSLSSYGSNTLGAALRWSDGNHFYGAFINGKTLMIAKKVGGVLTKLGSVTFAATAGTGYSMRFRVVGATLSAKVWAIGTSEPSGWLVTASDSSLTAGNCGVVLYLANGVTANITSFLTTSQ